MTSNIWSTVLLASVIAAGCGQPPNSGKAEGKQAKQSPTPANQPPANPQPAKPAPPVEAGPPIQPTPPTEPAPPIEPAPTEAAPPSEPAQPSSPAGWTPPTNPTDLRGDEVIPPGTPEAHVKAFKKLPVAKGDGVPVGGIGANGIHIDALEVGAGWESSHCTDPTTTFAIGSNDRVNVCLRIVHPRGVKEELTVQWIKNGKNTRRSKVAVSDMHAYLTRAYLPIATGYEGEWKAVIETADGTVLAEAAFTVK